MRAAIVLILAASGCVTTQQFVFRPTETSNLTAEDRAVARYVVPRVLPRGELFVTSEGIESNTVVGKNVPCLHVGITVFNVAGEAPWAIDIRDQMITLPGGPQVRASNVKTTAPGAPILAIGPGERVAMDLFFVLPEQQQTPSQVSAFDFIWQVTTDRKHAAGNIPFGRFEASPTAGPGPALATATHARPF